MTVADIIAEVRGELIEDSAQEWSDVELLRFLNDGAYLIQQFCGWYQRTENIVPVVGQQDYTLPDDIHKIICARFDRAFLPQTTQYELERDAGNWRGTANGTPIRHFEKAWDTISLYPKPNVAGTTVTLDSEFGIVIRAENPSGTTDPDVTMDSEFGVVIAVEDSDGGQIRMEGDVEGILGQSHDLGCVVAWSDDEDNLGLVYEALPDILADNTDVPQMPTFVQPALVPYVTFRAFKREGPMQDLALAEFYFADFADWMEVVLEKQERQWPDSAVNLEPTRIGSRFERRLNEIGASSVDVANLRAHYE